MEGLICSHNCLCADPRLTWACQHVHCSAIPKEWLSLSTTWARRGHLFGPLSSSVNSERDLLSGRVLVCGGNGSVSSELPVTQVPFELCWCHCPQPCVRLSYYQ